VRIVFDTEYCVWVKLKGFVKIWQNLRNHWVDSLNE